MTKTLMLAAASGLALLAALPATAQAPTNDRKLVIYGGDRCPANTICVRAPESERYRIPKSIRESTPSDEASPGGRNASLVASNGPGAAGTGSCTATGGGGWTGCWKQQMQAARAEKKMKKEEDMYPQQ